MCVLLVGMLQASISFHACWKHFALPLLYCPLCISNRWCLLVFGIFIEHVRPLCRKPSTPAAGYVYFAFVSIVYYLSIHLIRMITLEAPAREIPRFYI